MKNPQIAMPFVADGVSYLPCVVAFQPLLPRPRRIRSLTSSVRSLQAFRRCESHAQKLERTIQLDKLPSNETVMRQ